MSRLTPFLLIDSIFEIFGRSPAPRPRSPGASPPARAKGEYLSSRGDDKRASSGGASQSGTHSLDASELALDASELVKDAAEQSERAWYSNKKSERSGAL